MAPVHAIRGHNNWSRPSREEVRAAIESLPSRYCQDLERVSTYFKKKENNTVQLKFSFSTEITTHLYVFKFPNICL